MDIALLVASQVTSLTATLDALFGIMGTSCMVLWAQVVGFLF